MTRRDFFRRTAFTTLGIGIAGGFPAPVFCQNLNASSKLNLAHVGVAGMQGAFHIGGTETENRVAICDVDTSLLDKAAEIMPDAKKYQDFRVMFDEMGDKIDGVIITTPDHTHAVAAVAAMKKGINCYVEKPLAHDPYQIRLMQKLAKEKNLVTQMGTQIHALDNYRRVVELVQAGAVGRIKEVHVWVGVVWGGTPATTDKVECPASLDWDLWIGPAPMRDYQPCYFKGNWRSFWDFGNGGMGDMACHYMDLPFWALGLRYPLTVEASAPTPADKDFAAKDLMVKYEFPALDGSSDLLPLTWYDGSQRPAFLADYGLENKGSGVLFVGTDGVLYSNYTEHALLPEDKFKDYKTPAQTIPPSVGHHAEWIEAIKDRSKKTLCNFDYSGTLAETVLLGPIAYRCGQKLQYDAQNMAASNCKEAEAFIHQGYRQGWEI